MDVIIITHAWSSHPFDDFILFEYFAMPQREVEEAFFFYYAGVQLQTGTQSNAYDNLVYYDENRKMLVVDDQPGGDDDEIGIIGYMLFQPDGYKPEDLNWTFDNTTTDLSGVGFPQNPTNFYWVITLSLIHISEPTRLLSI